MTICKQYKLIFVILIILILFYIYFCCLCIQNQKQTVYKEISLEQLVPTLKSGDLLLFEAGDAPFQRRFFMNGRWTHVGIIEKNEQDGKLYALDADNSEHRKRIELNARVYNYYHSSTKGLIAVRRLKHPLTKEQLEKFNYLVNNYFVLSSAPNSSSTATIVSSNNSPKLWTRYQIPRSYVFPILFTNHTFPFLKPVSIDKVYFDLCTDSLIQFLSKIGLVNTSTIPAILTPSYFSSEKDGKLNDLHFYSKINSQLINNTYEEEIVINL